MISWGNIENHPFLLFRSSFFIISFPTSDFPQFYCMLGGNLGSLLYGGFRDESENMICLDPYILNSFSYLDPISINVSQCMASLLKLEITLSFLVFIASSFRVTEED